MKKIILITLVLLAGCASPKKVVHQMLKEKDIERYQSYLAEDCKNYLKSRDNLVLTTPYATKIRTFQILDQEKGDNYYYVSAQMTLTEGNKIDFKKFPNNDLRFRLIREDGKWKVVLINCINFKDETLMKSGQ